MLRRRMPHGSRYLFGKGVTTFKNTVVQPGMVLLNLVPVGEHLLAKVQVKNEDAGFVQKGQPVRIKVAKWRPTRSRNTAW
jgi:HlyD family secretion protein